VLYNLDLLYDNDDYNPPKERVRSRMEDILRGMDRNISGALYISQYPRDVTGVIPSAPFPVVYAYCYTNDGAPSVNTNDQQGAYIAVQQLISLRKKRIAMISGPINSIPMTKRLSGYQRALIDAGLPVALASDYNPGTAPSGNMRFVVSLASIKMKMTPVEALNAATMNSAAAMGESKEYGSITRGKVANFYITKPLPSLAYLPYAHQTPVILKVVLKGEIVNI
jgi:DNA-binding LacI/PurR family transcriptional regulator